MSCSKQRLIVSPKRSFAVSLEGYGDHLFKGIYIHLEPIRKLFLNVFAREYSFYKFFMFDSEESRHWFLPCIYVYITVFIAILQSIGAVAAPYLAKQNLPANALESNWATNGNADKVCALFRKLFAIF